MSTPTKDSPSDTSSSRAPSALRDPKRPEFLDAFPDEPALRPLIDAFVNGNYRELRRLEKHLRSVESDPDTRGYAHELVLRTEASPTTRRLLYLSVGFFLFLLYWVYFGQSHG